MNFGAPAFQLSADRSVIGRIEIPRIGLKTVILEGVAQRTLSLAVGHIPGTALPGTSGNVGIAGHRDTFFRSLRDVQPGDSIVLTTFEGAWEYRVESSSVVPATHTGVLEDSRVPELTLVTCYPFSYIGPAPDRYIVHARRVSS
jgi:sortase A